MSWKSNFEEIDIRSLMPHYMKAQLISEAKKLISEKKTNAFKISASMEQHHEFKKEYGRSMQSFIVELITPQEPIHTRRTLS